MASVSAKKNLRKEICVSINQQLDAQSTGNLCEISNPRSALHQRSSCVPTSRASSTTGPTTSAEIAYSALPTVQRSDFASRLRSWLRKRLVSHSIPPKLGASNIWSWREKARTHQLCPPRRRHPALKEGDLIAQHRPGCPEH